MGSVDELRAPPGVGREEDGPLELRFADLVLNEATREVWRGGPEST